MIKEDARDLLGRYRLGRPSIFFIGAFDTGITIFSQQVRALNLAWALIESGEVDLDTAQGSDVPRTQIAIVGAGFAGLTVAAGLLKKRVNADITVFEQRDTLLPLQQGCDTRWLHPHIYDWPNPGSEATSATLPVLNWKANRASDVVVQILKEWSDIAEFPAAQPPNTQSQEPTTTLYCNTRYIQISEPDKSSALTVEWLGEARAPHDPASAVDQTPGGSKKFHIVVLAIGFGLETDSRISYWRNDTCAQPELGQSRKTYIVSGAGDGALIDLCRLRIANFRQDRILAELFADRPKLVDHLRTIHHSRVEGLQEIADDWDKEEFEADKSEVLKRLRSRLRQDTTVLLRVLEPRFTKLFVNHQVSFQDRLLTYLLYRCGAFTLVRGKIDNSDLKQLREEYGVPDERVIIRHGTQKKEGFAALLPTRLNEEVAKYIEEPGPHQQTDVPAWLGGYFNMPGIRQSPDAGYQPSNNMLSTWRREYLPSPTEAVAVAFCSAVAGFLAQAIHPSSRLRVTLHRRLFFGNEILLQQCCIYQGFQLDEAEGAEPGPAGNVFSCCNGTIGAAYTLRSIVHTLKGATKEALCADMKTMNLSELAQETSREVASLIAIPLVAKAADAATKEPPVVVAVLYVDSYDTDAFIGDTITQLVEMCHKFLFALPEVAYTADGSIANIDFWKQSNSSESAQTPADPKDWKALWKSEIEPPSTAKLRYLNFDFSDFAPVEPT
jgi:FAD dependent oxidoreductase